MNEQEVLLEHNLVFQDFPVNCFFPGPLTYPVYSSVVLNIQRVPYGVTNVEKLSGVNGHMS